ncbi:hypothetical protein GCM10008955_41060 [Deinococcus malanensis]|uniref:Transposase n=1 Tax=Deinococcus malanensis TaxID=1706855 RepID=A0ABQ2F2X6_9DEIO|nr:hypothetical protein [Deinococcus malanensis]GGK43075.1 hypothetical protein GCM10008955_41060 [Deinococcus malanensis]
MTGPRTYRSGQLRATVHGAQVTLDIGTRKTTVDVNGQNDRERIERAMTQIPRGRKDFQRAARTRARILLLRDEGGRPA